MSWLLRGADRAYLVTEGERLETDLGVIEIPADLEGGETVESHLGESFTLTRPRPIDLFHHLDRSGAPMIPRDIGLIVGLAGFQAGDHLLDIGTGTGILAITLARLGINVTTFEKDERAASIARKNIERAGVEHAVELREADAQMADVTRPIDGLTLDSAEAPVLVERFVDDITRGGAIAAYAPFVETANAIETAASEHGLSDIRTYETIQREMVFDERGSRPTTAPVGHTGFITIGRKL